MTIDHREQLERIKAEIADSFDEELEMQLEEDRLDALVAEGMTEPATDTLDRKIYFRELFRLQPFGKLGKHRRNVVQTRAGLRVAHEV